MLFPGCGRRALIRSVASIALALTAALASGTGDARADAPTRAEIQSRLEKAPRGLAPSDVTELGAGAGPLLAQIADDKAVSSPIRLRAMAALAYVRTPRAHDFLEDYVVRMRPSSDAVDRALLRKAAIALGWQSGPRTVEVLAALLDHPDAEVRLDAVVALGLARTQRAEKPLRARLAVETDPAVRAQIDRELKLLAGRAPG